MTGAAGANTRALAALALQRIVDGASLRVEFEAAAAQLPDGRDRALLSALLHAGARWWLRYAAGVDLLLERPLPKHAVPLRALLALGIVQIEALQMPGYAVVDASVEAARALGKPAFAGLVNAILRRWLRERAALGARLDRDIVTRTAHPRWLLDALAADWGALADTIVAADNTEAPLWLRANRRRSGRDALAARLRSAGVVAQMPEAPDDALLLEAGGDVTGLPGFAAGEFSVQDGAAQFAAELIDARDGQRVLDACAAPGGKTAHILERADVRLLALDRDEKRLPRIGANLVRLGLHAEIRAGDAAQPDAWWDGERFDRILLDAPCSATGIIRRQSDVKLHRRADDVAALAGVQGRLLEALWPLLAPGGRLVYATCSVLHCENDGQIERFRARHADATPVGAAALPPWRAAGAGAVQNLPGESGMDGFFYAVLEKHR
jgi:16S rRNA (cytosine967-C5)-methyltransferase